MRIIQNILSLLWLLLIVSCDRQTESKSIQERDSNPKEQLESAVDTTKSTPNLPSEKPLLIDSTAIKQYAALLDSANPYEQKIINRIIGNIKGHKDFKDEILTVGDIDGIDDKDTIKTYIEVKNDSVHLRSVWFREGQLIWEDKMINPYMWIGEAKEFNYDSGDVWMKWTVAKDYSVPKLTQRSEYPQIEDEMVVNFGVRDLKKKNIEAGNYRKYLHEFNGEILEYGEPERRKLVIWYEPEQTFITYYAP